MRTENVEPSASVVQDRAYAVRPVAPVDDGRVIRRGLRQGIVARERRDDRARGDALDQREAQAGRGNGEEPAVLQDLTPASDRAPQTRRFRPAVDAEIHAARPPRVRHASAPDPLIETRGNVRK